MNVIQTCRLSFLRLSFAIVYYLPVDLMYHSNQLEIEWDSLCAGWVANNELDYTRQMCVAGVEAARNRRRECRRFEHRSLCLYRTSNDVEREHAGKNDVKTTEWDGCGQKE